MLKKINELTHWGLVMHVCVSRLSHHWFWLWLVTWTVPSHYLNQCWNSANWTLRNKLRWNFNQNSNIFIQENWLENVVCEMESIFSQPQCVKASRDMGSWLVTCVVLQFSEIQKDTDYTIYETKIVFRSFVSLWCFHCKSLRMLISVKQYDSVLKFAKLINSLRPSDVYMRQ